MNRVLNLNKENVIVLNAFKKNQELIQEEKSVKAYFKLLGFNELVSEANSMIIEIQNKTMNNDLALRSKTIVREFKTRSSAANPLMAKALGQISQNIEKNISLLTNNY